MSVEEERKYGVDAHFVLPDLAGYLPEGGSVTSRPAVTLTATYYDTEDLRLARAGASLRHRAGDGDKPWTVKLPTGAPGSRHEIDRPGDPGTVPADLVALVAAYHRGAPLSPVVTIRTTRLRHDLRDTTGTPLAEVADDSVAVLDGKRVTARFREIEVERKAGGRKLLGRVGDALTSAGATGGTFLPKHARALGEPAARPADLVPPRRRPSRTDSAAEVVTYALASDIVRMVEHDPLVRLRATVGHNDTAVHQMRVGTRRLRTDLRTFARLLDSAWAAPVEDALRWLSTALGAARDTEVLRERLRRTAGLDPAYPLDADVVAHVDDVLAVWQAEALGGLDAVMGSPRYLDLLDTLIAAAAGPPTSGLSVGPADTVLPPLVARQWRRFATRADALLTPADGPGGGHPDEEWHEVRKLAKRARYAAEVAALSVGAPAADLASGIASVAELLGAHQDACVAAQTWLQVTRSAPTSRRLAVGAARLFERERDAARAAQAAFRPQWERVRGEHLTGWLR